MAIDTQALSDRMTAIEARLEDVQSVLQTLQNITMQAVRVMEELSSAETQAEIDALTARAQVVLEMIDEDVDIINVTNGTLNTEVIKVDPSGE